MTMEEEKAFLAPFLDKAASGGILVVGEIKKALDERLGRNGGFRGYTYKQDLTPEEWRVHVETENGRTVVTHDFSVVTDAPPEPDRETVGGCEGEDAFAK